MRDQTCYQELLIWLSTLISRNLEEKYKFNLKQQE